MKRILARLLHGSAWLCMKLVKFLRKHGYRCGPLIGMHFQLYVWEMRATGYSWREIADRLEAFLSNIKRDIAERKAVTV